VGNFGANMDYVPIKKDVVSSDKSPNMPNYLQIYTHFNWQQASERIKGYKNGINMGYEAVDQHVEDGHGETNANA
jgi:acetyl-CoA synthetase